MASSDKDIQVLSPRLVDKIAAGEVIERPASVAKELIENAIDAGATRISVTVEDAGFSLIRVADNGCGMAADDLAQCVLRHATSKIRSVDDLYSLATLGFRGEALASIGAVSRMEIVSSATDDGLGTILRVVGGAAEGTAPASRSRGTTVSVRDLFFNTPARKKFMKSRKAERTHLMRFFEQITIPFPAIHFTLSAESKSVIDAPAVANPRERVAQICGPDFARRLIECTGSADGMDAVLLVSHPQDARPRPRYQNLYVNLRMIESDAVSFAIRNAFRNFAPADLRPAFFCFLDVSPERVDVNVHPTKQRVKFDNEQRVFGSIYHVVDAGVKKGLGDLAGGRDSADTTEEDFPRFAQDRPVRDRARQPQGVAEMAGEGTAAASPEADGSQTVLRFPTESRVVQKKLEGSQDSTIQLGESSQEEFWDLISCYQIHDTFVLAPIKNGILLIDQHAAHERILFEQAAESLEKGHAESQQLLFPITIELSATEKAVVDANRQLFSSLGYEVGDFGGNTVCVSAMPAFMKTSQVGEAVREMIRYVLGEKTVENFSDPQMRFAAAFACGSALKAGQKLTHEEMNALLNNLFATKNPYSCPHGRPTLVRISLDELRRRFLR